MIYTHSDENRLRCAWNDKIKVAVANVDSAILTLETVKKFLVDYKVSGSEEMMETATKIATENEIEPVFASRVGRKRHHEGEIVQPIDIFKSDFFNYLIEVATNSITERFDSLTQHYKYFAFLYDLNTLEESSENGKLLEHCQSLQKILTKDDHSDIDANELCNEMAFVATLIKKYDVCKPIDVLTLSQSWKWKICCPTQSLRTELC